MTPTQAQIEAAAKAAWEIYKGYPWPKNQEQWEKAIAAALTAAAEVGPTLAPGCCSAISPCSYQREHPNDICPQCIAAAEGGEIKLNPGYGEGNARQ